VPSSAPANGRPRRSLSDWRLEQWGCPCKPHASDFRFTVLPRGRGVAVSFGVQQRPPLNVLRHLSLAFKTLTFWVWVSPFSSSPGACMKIRRGSVFHIELPASGGAGADVTALGEAGGRKRGRDMDEPGALTLLKVLSFAAIRAQLLYVAPSH
jgi:hypothetical protein